MTVPLDDESFAAGRQALLDALQGLEQRAHDRAERTLREAEQRAREVIIDSEAHAHQVTAEAELRADRLVSEAEQRSRQVTLEAVQRVAELEQQLAEVRDNLESARAQLEEQFVAIRGLVEVARANLNTARDRAAGTSRGAEPRGPMRVSIPPLSGQTTSQAPTGRATSAAAATPPAARSTTPLPEGTVAGASLDDLRAAVDALKRPRRGEVVGEVSDEEDETGLDEDQAAHEQPAQAESRQ